MKRACRLVILFTAFVSTYVVAVAPRVPAPDGGPLPMCPPKKGPNCQLQPPHAR
jgi:hypothetical protein